MQLKDKGLEWLKRYLPAEIAGTITAIIFASIANLLLTNSILVAYAGSLGEALGFYSTVIIQNLLVVIHRNKKHGTVYHHSDFTKIFTSIVLEFGPAGALDGMLLRPLFMYLGTTYFSNFTLGILAGKLMGDITFYLMVILSYEIQKRIKKPIL